MTDEKKNPEEDEVSDEQLEEVAGGTVASFAVAALADQAAQESALADKQSAKAAMDVTRGAVQDLTAAIKEMADIRKTTLDDVNDTKTAPAFTEAVCTIRATANA